MTTRKKWIIGISVAAMLILIILIVLGSNSKSTGTIKKKADLPPAVAHKPQRLDGKNFTTMYPGNYTLKSNTPKDRNSIEQYVMLASLPGVRQAAVTVRGLPPGGLAQDGNYKLRQTYPDQYTESIRQVGQNRVVLMTKAGGVEYVAFITKGNLLATVALTTEDQQGDLEGDIMQFIKDWQWKD